MVYKAFQYAGFLFLLAIAQFSCPELAFQVWSTEYLLLVAGYKLQQAFGLAGEPDHVACPMGCACSTSRFPSDADLALYMAVPNFGLVLVHMAEELYHLLHPEVRPAAKRALQHLADEKKIKEEKQEEEERAKVSGEESGEGGVHHHHSELLYFAPELSRVLPYLVTGLDWALVGSNIVLTVLVLAVDRWTILPLIMGRFFTDPLNLMGTTAYALKRYQMIYFV